MRDSNSGIAALVLIAGLSGRAPAQAPKSDPGDATGAYPVSQVAGGLAAYYGMTPNFANYGLSGTYPDHGGYGYNGYGPGAQFGAHYASSPVAKPSHASKKPGGPMNGIPKQAGKSSRFDDGTTRGLASPRKGL